jgi:hypothetical protein
VDESGNQIAVFGRRGARPFTFAEIQRTLRTNEGRGEFFAVTDDPLTQPRNLKTASADREADVKLGAGSSRGNSAGAMAGLIIANGLFGVILLLSLRRMRGNVAP